MIQHIIILDLILEIEYISKMKLIIKKIYSGRKNEDFERRKGCQDRNPDHRTDIDPDHKIIIMNYTAIRDRIR